MAGRTDGDIRARRGFFPVVVGEDVQLRQGGGLVFIARQDMEVTQGGGQWLIAARDQDIRQGGGAVLVSRNARVAYGIIGLLVSGQTTLRGSSRALVTVSAPVALAVAAGFAAGWLLGRFGGTRFN